MHFTHALHLHAYQQSPLQCHHPKKYSFLCALNMDIVLSSYLHNLRSEISGGAAEDEVSVRERECEPVLLALLEAI